MGNSTAYVVEVYGEPMFFYEKREHAEAHARRIGDGAEVGTQKIMGELPYHIANHLWAYTVRMRSDGLPISLERMYWCDEYESGVALIGVVPDGAWYVGVFKLWATNGAQAAIAARKCQIDALESGEWAKEIERAKKRAEDEKRCRRESSLREWSHALELAANVTPDEDIPLD